MAIDKWGIMRNLMYCFPDSFVNQQGEFIAHKYANAYFNLDACTSLLEVRCSILEYLSRAACKAQPYTKSAKNNQLHNFMCEGINRALGTDFTKDDMLLIYKRLGNGVNRGLTVEFVMSGYDMKLLEREGKT